MSLADVATIVTIIDHEWSESLTVQSVSADVLFFDIFEVDFEFGIRRSRVCDGQRLFLCHVWIVQYTLTSLG